MKHKILAINLGATSTKVAYYTDKNCEKRETINHDIAEIKRYDDVMDQYEYRLSVIKAFLDSEGIDINSFDAVVSRGGHTHPIPSGVYLINEKMMNEIKSGEFGRHPCDIGAFIAVELCKDNGAKALVVDPPVTDEFDDVARISGMNGIERTSRFHALNHKAIAREFAEDQGKRYEDLNLIVIHMGGGISVCAHEKGRMIDANNGLEGEGPFSSNRSGAICARDIVELCFDKGLSKAQVMKRINGDGGLVSYLGTVDLIEVLKRIESGDKEAALVFDAMAYQTSKEIGSMAVVLKGNVDGIILTGGMANSNILVDRIKDRVSFIADIYVYPGENEMKALANGALRALKQECPIIEL